MEGGWPGANPTDDGFFADPPALARARIVAFGMTRRAGRSAANDPGLAAVLAPDVPAACLVGKTWDFHVDVALGISREENLVLIADSVRLAAARKTEVLFDAEHFFDGYKADPGFALDCLEAALEAGARWLVLCDTNGGTLPHEVARIVAEVAARVPPEALGIHAHDDTGNAVANSLAAVGAGARQVQGTVNGLGERCGNANLVSIIPSLTLKMGYTTGVDADGLAHLTSLSRLVDERPEPRPRPARPFVGEAVFAHKGGLHASAVEKDPCTYEHMDPERVGNRRHIVVSDQSGRANILARFRDIGLDLDPADPEVGRLAAVVKAREFEGYAYDGAEASFELLARSSLGRVPEYYRLTSFRVIERAPLERPRRPGHPLGGDGEADHRRSGHHGGGRWQRPGQRPRPGVAQGAAARLPPARRPQAGGLQGAHPLAGAGHRRRYPGDDRIRRRPRRALVHRRRLHQRDRRLVRRAARQHRLQALPGRRARGGASRGALRRTATPAVVLVRPQLGENIGMVARAMHNCGLSDLRLVAPRRPWPNPHAAAAAAGAACVLEGVRLFPTTAAAVADLRFLLASTARPRRGTQVALTPEAAAEVLRARGAAGAASGILFGKESRGLDNDDVALADAILTVPLNPAFTSLNLAQAVLLIAYAWYRAGEAIPPSTLAIPRATRPATKGELLGFFQHLEGELEACGFFHVAEKRPVMARNLRGLFQRAALTEQEVRTCAASSAAWPAAGAAAAPAAAGGSCSVTG